MNFLSNWKINILAYFFGNITCSTVIYKPFRTFFHSFSNSTSKLKIFCCLFIHCTMRSYMFYFHSIL